MNPSLLLIPDRYKASKLYSQIPDSGAGDLAFTRALDTATRVNSAGLIEKVRTNLALQSEDFSNVSVWATNAAPTITANTTVAPNGTATADTIAATAVNSGAYQLPSVSAGTPYAFSVYIKNISSATAISIGCDLNPSNATLVFNAVSGTITSVGAGITASSVTNEGNGWYRVFGTYIATGSPNTFLVFGGGVMSFAVWGAMFQAGDILTPYIPTTTAAVSVGPVANIPRIDYTGGGCGKLLLEPQRTNLLTFSEQFDNAAYTKTNLTITANTTAAPDGTTSADTATTTSSVSELYQSSSTAVTTATCSLFVKKSTHKYFGISINGTNNFDSRYQGVFDLDLGTVFQENNSTTPLTNRSSKIESYGNGWYRISVTATFATSANAFVVFQQSNNVPTIPSDNLAWNNSSIGSTFVWGAQVEAGAYPTSYIPTLGASVTRSADAASKTGISSLIGQSEGVFYFDAANLFLSGARSIALAFTSGAAYYQIYLNASNQVRVDVNGSLLLLGGTIVENTRYKIAVAYKAGDNALYINGSQIATSASTTIPASLNDFYLGNSLGTEQSGSYNASALYTTRLSNSDLASLTTL